MNIREKMIKHLGGPSNPANHAGADRILEDLGMTFDEVQEACEARTVCFPGEPGEEWSALEWAGALTGEQGEFITAFMKWVAAGGNLANLAKKVKRDGADNRDEMAKEIADVVIYSFILAMKLNLNLGVEVARKFNEVSDRRDQYNLIQRNGKPKAPQVREI